jgi:hypothetical protein
MAPGSNSSRSFQRISCLFEFLADRSFCRLRAVLEGPPGCLRAVLEGPPGCLRAVLNCATGFFRAIFDCSAGFLDRILVLRSRSEAEADCKDQGNCNSCHNNLYCLFASRDLGGRIDSA